MASIISLERPWERRARKRLSPLEIFPEITLISSCGGGGGEGSGLAVIPGPPDDKKGKKRIAPQTARPPIKRHNTARKSFLCFKTISQRVPGFEDSRIQGKNVLKLYYSYIAAQTGKRKRK
jgi:hypothetical protein